MDSDGGNIVNFSSFRKTSRDERKRANRQQKEKDAAANRVRFGRTGAEKKQAKREAERRARLHEGKKLGTGGPDESPDGPPGA
jgi:ATPase subunit of ABC transporter with duplicated ATPase domains